MIGASSFENYLLEQGFIPYHYTKNGYVPYLKNYIQYSTMDVLLLKYTKGNIEIYYGLHEINHPPLLISPRLSNKTAQDIDRMFETMTNEQILKLIYDTK